MKSSRWTRYGLAALAAWPLGHTLVVVADGLTDSHETADVAVILGNKVNEDGTLSDRLTQRLECGLRLYRAGRVPKIVVSGGLGREGYSEGSKMKEFLLGRGVPDSVLIVDNQGNTTQQTVENVAHLRDSLHFARVLVVSQYYRGFRRVGGVSPAYFELRDLYSLGREFAAFYQQLLF
jgi:uncharacterized SAM-binding protein YcdF (DUF218 family)